MILKKPYAFFIKNFKLFHLIIFSLAAVLLYRTSIIYSFIKEYVKESPNVIGKELTDSLFVNWSYILIILLIAVNILIIIIMIRKSKPYMFYIVNIILYISVLVVYGISNIVISNLEVMLVEAKITMAIRDILNIIRMLQTISIIFYFVRATGFDIRKFDFVKDLQELDISEEDSEEYEVAVEFDSNEIFRKSRRIMRNLTYYYKENKFMLNIIILLLIGFIFLMIYSNISKYDKIYKENEYFNVNSFDIGIKQSYIVKKDYKQSNITTNEYDLIALRISVKSNIEQKLQNSRIVLVVDDYEYYHIKTYKNSLFDIGTIYNDQVITDEFKEYILVYQIPKYKLSSEMKFRYIDTIESKNNKKRINSIDVELNPIDIDKKEITNKEYNLTEEIDTSDSNVSNYKIIVNNFEISEKYTKFYNSCISETECYDFKEIIKPITTTNKDKALLKIEGNITSETKINNINDLYSLFKTFGSIEYTYNGVKYTERNDFNQVKFTKINDGAYYIEVDKEIINATEIKLNFNIRNNKYSYILRGNTNE